MRYLLALLLLPMTVIAQYYETDSDSPYYTSPPPAERTEDSRTRYEIDRYYEYQDYGNRAPLGGYSNESQRTPYGAESPGFDRGYGSGESRDSYRDSRPIYR